MVAPSLSPTYTYGPAGFNGGSPGITCSVPSSFVEGEDTLVVVFCQYDNLRTRTASFVPDATYTVVENSATEKMWVDVHILTTNPGATVSCGFVGGGTEYLSLEVHVIKNSLSFVYSGADHGVDNSVEFPSGTSEVDSLGFVFRGIFNSSYSSGLTGGWTQNVVASANTGEVFTQTFGSSVAFSGSYTATSPSSWTTSGFVFLPIPVSQTLSKLKSDGSHFLTTESGTALDITSIEPVEFTDNFNRANGALGSDWNSDAKWKVQSNTAVYDSTGTQNLMVPNFTLPYDHFVQFDYRATTWPMIGSANNAVVAFLRMNGNQFNGYMFQVWQSEYNQQQIGVGRRNNGVLTDIIYDIYGGYDRTQDHTFWFGIKGRDIYVVIDGILYCKIHDVPNANGFPHDGANSNANVGLSEVDWIGLGTVSIDNFVAGSFDDGTLFTIFTDNFTAADGTDWNTRGVYKKGWEIDSYSATDHGKIVNNRLRLYSGTGAYGNKGATLFHGTSTSPSVGTIPTNDFELTADVVIGPFTTNPRMWFSLLENNDAVGWTVYCDQGGYAYIARSRGWSSSSVSVDGGGISYSPGDVIHWKIRCTPTSCKFKIWKNSASEPTSWNSVLEYLDPTSSKGGLLSFKVSTWDTGEDIYMDLDNINVTCY